MKCFPHLMEIRLLVTDLASVYLNCLFITYGCCFSETNEQWLRECLSTRKQNKIFSTIVTAFLISSGISCLLETTHRLWTLFFKIEGKEQWVNNTQSHDTYSQILWESRDYEIFVEFARRGEGYFLSFLIIIELDISKLWNHVFMTPNCIYFIRSLWPLNATVNGTGYQKMASIMLSM